MTMQWKTVIERMTQQLATAFTPAPEPRLQPVRIAAHELERVAPAAARLDDRSRRQLPTHRR